MLNGGRSGQDSRPLLPPGHIRSVADGGALRREDQSGRDNVLVAEGAVNKGSDWVVYSQIRKPGETRLALPRLTTNDQRDRRYEQGQGRKTHPYSYSLLADCRLEYLGDLGRGLIVGAAGPPQSRVERRHAAVVHDGHFRAAIDQILDHAGPSPLHRAE
jgi:hypothetical protein